MTSPKRSADARERVEIKSRAEWRRWLAKHHAQTDAIWLVRWKKDRGPYVSYDDIVDEALCYGWIDSLPRVLDDDRTMLLIAPRKPKSAWSAVNKKRVARLMAEGRMAAPGLAAIETAKANGAWEKLDGVETPPADLVAAFKRYPGSAKNFAAFPPSVRRGILEWIVQAKKPDTRAKRIEETAALAGQNKRANQWRG